MKYMLLIEAWLAEKYLRNKLKGEKRAAVRFLTYRQKYDT